MEKKKNMEQLVINVSQGIYPPYELFYLESLRDTSRKALNAFHRYHQLLGKGGEKEAIATAIHEALMHSAALSRYFWPVSSKNKLCVARGKKLKEAFQIKDDSALRINFLRNALEHYDERLDQFLLENHAGLFHPRPIIGSISIAEGKIDKVFRLVDPELEILILLGEKYEFKGVHNIVENIFNETVRMIGYGGRFTIMVDGKAVLLETIHKTSQTAS